MVFSRARLYLHYRYKKFWSYGLGDEHRKDHIKNVFNISGYLDCILDIGFLRTHLVRRLERGTKPMFTPHDGRSHIGLIGIQICDHPHASLARALPIYYGCISGLRSEINGWPKHRRSCESELRFEIVKLWKERNMPITSNEAAHKR